jgi:hypothetical protein
LVCLQFWILSSWWWVEKLPETCRALTTIKNVVQHCILLAICRRILWWWMVPWTSNLLVNGLKYQNLKIMLLHHCLIWLKLLFIFL